VLADAFRGCSTPPRAVVAGMGCEGGLDPSAAKSNVSLWTQKARELSLNACKKANVNAPHERQYLDPERFPSVPWRIKDRTVAATVSRVIDKSVESLSAATAPLCHPGQNVRGTEGYAAAVQMLF
jgi:hypothetical protein